MFSKALLFVCVAVVILSAAIMAIVLTRPERLPSFGHALKESAFLISPGVFMLNHGSYGAAPRPVLEAAYGYSLQMEQNTQAWFGGPVRTLMVETRQKLADYVDADIRDIQVVDNASSGVNAFLRSLELLPGEKILQLSVAYPMVKNTLQFLQERWGAEIIVVNVGLPTSPQLVLDTFEAALNTHNFSLAVFDHISSSPSLILPVTRLVQMCKARGLRHLIDGAHAVGQVPLSMRQMDPDAYVSNAHKWLCSSKGGAFLYVRRELQSSIPVHPVVISNTFGGLAGNKFSGEFRWEGTKTLSQHIAIKDALEFRERFGDQSWYDYNNNLCRDVARALGDFGYTLPAPPEMTASLVTLQIPTNAMDVPAASKILVANQIFVVLFEYEGMFYVRLSCQVYNELADYLYFAKVMAEQVLK